MLNRIIAVALVFHFCATMAAAQQARGHRVDPRNLDWHDAAKAQNLTADELRLLEQNKFVIGDTKYKQVFEPYLGGSVPVFITSDSLLNAYHVLLEGSLKHVEHAQATRLRKLLPVMWQGLDGPDKDAAGDSALVKAARRRARIVVGTAIKLLGDQPLDPPAEADIAGIIDKEVKKAVEGKAMEKPAWLGKGDKGFRALDYSRFIPRGLYAGDAPLERYFRAVAWLQAIPFRVDNDEELVSAMLLSNSLAGHDDELHVFFRPYREFLGNADDLGLQSEDGILLAPDPTKIALPQGLADIRAAMHAQGDRRLGRVNDQVRDGSAPGEAPGELAIRVLPPRMLPDAAMFQETTDRRHFPREYPSGLEVAALLGSPFAKAHLDPGAKYRDDLLSAIAQYEADDKSLREQRIYGDYLQAVAALFEPPDKDVPPLFSSPAWQAKNCQTALAGWAQMRHAWILQTKESISLFGATPQPSGFIEPTPEFFSRFASVVTETESCMRDAGAFDPDVGMAAAELREVAQIIDNSKADSFGMIGGAESPQNWQAINFVQDVARELRNADHGLLTSSLLKSDAPKLRALADQLDRGEMPANLKVRQALLEGCKTDVAPLWQSMALMCRRLEALSQKQLRGVAFTAEEDQFIKDYGHELAAYMLYFGESYDNPRDDAPRVADVFMNPQEGKLLEAGIGRAQVIYLLYPWQGREILCRGAVMPYYEFTHDRRMNDGDWKALLDSPARPDLPDWVKPIYGSAGVRK